MRHLCTKCSYIYDDILWDTEEEINPGEELIVCPVCEGQDTFQWIEEEINYVDDKSDLTGVEIGHYPEVEIKGNIMKVTIGDEMHPMWLEHRISAISLLDEYWDIIKTNFLELEHEAMTEFDFDNLDVYEIRAYCTVHGVWGRKFGS